MLKTTNLLFWIILFLIALSLLIELSGCAIIERVSDTFFNPGTEQIIPTVPKARMWETIKGLTPNWLAIPIIALGAVAMFNGAAKLGMSCIIFGSVNLFMALATSRFGFYMALFGLIGSMAAVAASIVAKNKAVKELVMGVQALKPVKDGDYSATNKILANIQTKTTKKIVQKIKGKLKLEGTI